MEKQTQTLAKLSPTQLERFLVELANLQDEMDAIKRFQERFAVFIPPHDQDWIERLAAEKEDVASQLSKLSSDVSLEEIGKNAWIVTLKQLMRNLWIEPDQRQKEWGAFAFRYALYQEHDPSKKADLFGVLHDPARSFRIPPPTPFEQALMYLVKASDKARYCANPECPASYFFVQRKNQRYCSEICAAPAQRELKRQWWAEHGEEWRASRQSQKPSKKGSNKGKSSKMPKQTTKKGK